MNQIKFVPLILVLILQCFPSNAQEVVLVSGSLEFLKNQTNLNVEFVYDGMKVSEFTEEIYLKQKRSEFRKPADGDKFVKKWVMDRNDSYEPKFMEKLNYGLKKLNIVSEKNIPVHTYTMVVKTVKTEPGFFDGSAGMKRDTYIDLVITFFDSTNRKTNLCTLKAEKMVGITEEQNDMKETNLKITQAYVLVADKLSKLMVKILTKKEKVKEDPEEMKKPIKNDKNNIDSEGDEDELDKPIKNDNKEKKSEDQKEKSEKPIKNEKKSKKDPNDYD